MDNSLDIDKAYDILSNQRGFTCPKQHHLGRDFQVKFDSRGDTNMKTTIDARRFLLPCGGRSVHGGAGHELRHHSRNHLVLAKSQSALATQPGDKTRDDSKSTVVMTKMHKPVTPAVRVPDGVNLRSPVCFGLFSSRADLYGG